MSTGFVLLCVAKVLEEAAPGFLASSTIFLCRSFEPILRLLPQGISPVSQHWATWALYNLVSVYRKFLFQNHTHCTVKADIVNLNLLPEKLIPIQLCSQREPSLNDAGMSRQHSQTKNSETQCIGNSFNVLILLAMLLFLSHFVSCFYSQGTPNRLSPKKKKKLKSFVTSPAASYPSCHPLYCSCEGSRTYFILFSAADKYCPLLIKEGGIPLLKDMIKMASARQETKEMARQETNALSSNIQFSFKLVFTLTSSEATKERPVLISTRGETNVGEEQEN